MYNKNRKKLSNGGKVMKVRELIFMVEEDPEGGFTARSLGEAIFTQGESIEEIKNNIKDAISCHFDKEEEIPAIIRLHIVREEIFTYV
jgi:predicted RNase H-like HicB family nuclease